MAKVKGRADPVGEYIKQFPLPQRATLEEVRKRLRKVLPTAVECISYGMPAFKVDGTVVAGFAGFKQHCSYFPHSGSVLPRIEKQIAQFESNAGTLRFPSDKPLSLSLLRLLVKTRLQVEAEKVGKGGRARSFYDDGTLRFTGAYKLGEMHGAWKFFRKDGVLLRAGSFKQGKQVGVWRTFDRQGKCLKETKF